MACFSSLCRRSTTRVRDPQSNPFLSRNISILDRIHEIIAVNPSLPAVLYDENELNYNMSGDKFLYIFCHETYMNTDHFNYRLPASRDGARDEAILLKDTVESYGFRCRIYYDMKYEEIVDIITRVSQQDHTRTSCLWLTMMTHSSSNALFAADMPYRLKPIENLLQNKNLAGIPKVLLLPYIRAGNEKPGIIDRVHPQIPENESYSASCSLSYDAAVALWFWCYDWIGNLCNQVCGTECPCPVCEAKNVDDGNSVQCASGKTIVHPSTADFLSISANNDLVSISILIQAICEAFRENQELGYGDLTPIINQKAPNNTDSDDVLAF